MPQRRVLRGLKKKFVLSQQGWQVFTVDPFAIRRVALPDEEFTNFATKDDFPDLIPAGEIWIARQNLEIEGLFFIANALAQVKQKEQGKPDKKAYEHGVQIERDLRRFVNGLEFRDGKAHKQVPPELYVERYITLIDREYPIDVWRVDGNLVRSWYKTDYTEGGHGQVYPWVPRHEIWVERDMDERELPFILSHEYLELRLMRDRRLSYDPAHAICSKMEFALRKGKGLAKLLALSRRRPTKRDLPRLTQDDVFRALIEEFLG